MSESWVTVNKATTLGDSVSAKPRPATDQAVTLGDSVLAAVVATGSKVAATLGASVLPNPRPIPKEALALSNSALAATITAPDDAETLGASVRPKAERNGNAG
jgi:hypothetical protein